MNSTESIGEWCKVKVLGSGGFGIVTLWKNNTDERLVALKMCREGVECVISSKHKERWAKEVEIMKRLSHPNVVKILSIPNDLEKLPSELPILCMEYCCKGDLRKVLNLSGNCSGLQEPDIRNLLRDVKAAVEFLHKQKVTHRDLKPENIVLQEMPNSGTVYKLIDLGYAKELDQNSLCSSFVGTLQYLAPELFTQVYTCSVDYWSLGLVCHEIITGFRPFLPNMTPVSWMTHVRLKSSDDICVYQNAEGNIQYSPQLFQENHISQCLRYEFEKWLRLALEWDGNKRGRAPDNSLIIFSSLDAVLNKKIITLFSVVKMEKLSYEVDSSTAVATMQLWVERDIKQPIADQVLLLPSGEQLLHETLAHQCWDTSCQDVMVYIFSKASFALPDVPPKLPPLVVRMLEAPKTLQPYYYLRRSWPNAVFFLHTELSLYQIFLEAYAVKMLYIMLKQNELSKMEHILSNEIHQVRTKHKFIIDSLDFDIKCHSKFHIKSSGAELTTGWLKKINAFDKKILQLNGLVEKVIQKVNALGKRLTLLQAYHEPGQNYVEKLKTLLEMGYKVYETLQFRPKELRETKTNSVDMVKVVYTCLKERDKMLRDQQFSIHLSEVSVCESEIANLLTVINEVRLQISKCSNDVTYYQLLRQKDIWQIVFSLTVAHNKNLKSDEIETNCKKSNPIKEDILPHVSISNMNNAVSKENSLLKSNQMMVHIGKTDKNNEAAFNENLVNGHNTLNNSEYFGQGSVDVGNTDQKPLNCLPEDTHNMILDNQNLRYAIQDCMTQSYQHYRNIISESTTLDWNFGELMNAEEES